MRALKILALVLLPLASWRPATRRSDAATGCAAYDTSADSNKRFLADYAARPA